MTIRQILDRLTKIERKLANIRGPGVTNTPDGVAINPPNTPPRGVPAAAVAQEQGQFTNGTVTGQVWQTVTENVNAHQFPVAHAIT